MIRLQGLSGLTLYTSSRNTVEELGLKNISNDQVLAAVSLPMTQRRRIFVSGIAAQEDSSFGVRYDRYRELEDGRIKAKKGGASLSARYSRGNFQAYQCTKGHFT